MQQQPSCPYCKSALAKEPERKTKCRNCGNHIYVRQSPELFQTAFLTKDDAEALDLFYQVQDYGLTRDGFEATKQELRQRRGREPFSSEVVWLLARRAAESASDLQDTKIIYYAMALFLNAMGHDATPVLEKSSRAELFFYRADGGETG